MSPFDACLDDGQWQTPSAIQLMPPVMAGLAGVEHARAELDERGFEVAGSSPMVLALVAVDGGVGEGPGITIASLNSCAADSPVGHGVAEVAGVGSGFL